MVVGPIAYELVCIYLFIYYYARWQPYTYKTVIYTLPSYTKIKNIVTVIVIVIIVVIVVVNAAADAGARLPGNVATNHRQSLYAGRLAQRSCGCGRGQVCCVHAETIDVRVLRVRGIFSYTASVTSNNTLLGASGSVHYYFSSICST